MRCTSTFLHFLNCLTTLPLVYGSPLTVDLEDGTGLLPRQAEPPVSDDNFRNCGSQTIIVKQALQDVQSLAKAAAGYGTSGYYNAWFGAQAGSVTDKSINKRYSRLSNWLNAPTKALFFNCDTGNAGCSRPTIAAFTTKFGGEIVLCRSWWDNPEKQLFKLTPPSPHQPSASLDNYVTQGVQLLHEMTHALFGTDDQNLTNGETAYSHKNTLLLAQEDPMKARGNADNYAFFAMAAYWARGHWSTDPNNLIRGDGGF